MTIAAILALALLVGLAAIPVVLEMRRSGIDKRARQGAPGAFAELSQGVTYYRWYGPTRGKVLVAIHGLTTPSAVWHAIAPGLALLGYRVLLFDLYGRGLSDAPGGVQDRRFFLTQLDDLLAALNLDDDLTVMGYSMGGSIATAFAQEQPHRIARLILLAPAGIAMTERPFERFCRVFLLAGDWAHSTFAARLMRRDISADIAATEVPDIRDVKLAQLRRSGFLRSVLSSRRSMLAETQDAAHREVGRRGIPVVAIWGEQDAVIPLAALGHLAQWNRKARQDVIKGAGHGLPYTHASDVLSVLTLMITDKS
jgi:pimeloyl-ACP methyl ester carboxylesterase